MTTITVSTGTPIQLGYQYDDYATEVVFPASIIEPFTTTYGSGGTFAIWYRRSGDATGYPIGNPLVVFNGTTVTWTVVETDVANPGQAQVQLRYIKDEHCVMSQMFTAIVEDSVDIGTEIPEPMEQWADAIIKAGSGGQPTAVTSSSSMTNHSAIYLYMGNESGYQYGHIYYWDGTYWADGGAYGGNTSGSGLTEDVKQALLACFENVAWIDDDGQDYVDALESALYPPENLLSISAVYTQSGVVRATDDIEDLRADLVVTANYDSGTTETANDYVLSGTLRVGTSQITVTYGGKTTTFTVNVSAGALASWDFTKSLVDKVNGYEVVLTNSNGTLTQTVNGLDFNANNVDFAATAQCDHDFGLGTKFVIKFGAITPSNNGNSGTPGSVYRMHNGLILQDPAQLFWRGVSDKFSGWYNNGWQDGWYTTVAPDFFANKTAEVYVNADGSFSVVCEGTTIMTAPAGTRTTATIGFGRSSGQTFYRFIVRRVEVYDL